MNQLNVSLWGDESFSALLSQKNIPDIIHVTSHDTAPPLYYIVLHFWMQFFGTSEIVLRSLSLTFFLLLGIAAYFFSREIFGKNAAIVSVFLIFLNPFLFQYAFESRMYMMLALTATASVWFFITKRWIAYVLVTVAALYTHHFAIFILLMEVVVYIFMTYSNRIFLNKKHFFQYLKKQICTPFFYSVMVILFLYSFWIPTLYLQVTRFSSDFWISKPKLADLFSLYGSFSSGGLRGVMSQVVFFSSSCLLIVRGYKSRYDVVLYLWLFFPAFVTFFLSLFGNPFFFDRYLIESTPAISFLLASSFQNATKKGISTRITLSYLKYLLIGVILSGLLSLNSIQFFHPKKEPFRDLTYFIKTSEIKNIPVINYYTDHLHYFELKYYGINVKIYSQSQLPFWVGTALINPKDVMNTLPDTQTILLMASGNIQQIHVPDYHELKQRQFGNLFLFWYIKNTS